MAYTMRSRSWRAICSKSRVALRLIRTEYAATGYGFCAITNSRNALRSIRIEQIMSDLVPIEHRIGWISQALKGDLEIVVIL